MIYLFLLFILTHNLHENYGARVRYMAITNCKSNDHKGMYFNTCEVGPKGLNVSFTVLKSTNKIMVSMETLMKRDGQFKKLVRVANIEWCEFVKKVRKEKNRFVRAIWDILKETMPDLFRKCPYAPAATLTGINMNTPSNLISFLPRTEYKINVEGYYYPPSNTNATFGVHVEIYD
jgi:hypothetical protein